MAAGLGVIGLSDPDLEGTDWGNRYENAGIPVVFFVSRPGSTIDPNGYEGHKRTSAALVSQEEYSQMIMNGRNAPTGWDETSFRQYH